MTSSETLVGLSTEDLTAALRTGAAGTLTDEAAIELLIEHGAWLALAEFRRRFVDYQTDPAVTGLKAPAAWIEWREAAEAVTGGTMPNVGGAADRVLLIAASLGAGVPVDLRATASNQLGRAHAAMVVKALIRSTGMVDHPEIVASWATP